jgi:RNA polymerase sigma factor (TIGR02999 family)
MPADAGEITRLLIAVRNGDAKAESRLVSLVYGELNKLAQNHMRRERAGHTLQPTALINEAYIRLMGGDHRNWNDRVHFLANASVVMRRVIVDYARQHRAGKRPGGKLRVELDEAVATVKPKIEDLLVIDEALRRLAELSPRQARLVEMMYFGGLTAQEASQVMGISLRTAEREWAAARAWLHQQLARKSP